MSEKDMINKETSTESASPETPADSQQGNGQSDMERMLGYRTWAAAFSYPDDSLFSRLPGWTGKRESLVREYDRLFRAGLVWLYEAEHLAENEFQRANLLADIMGFYTAFGLEPNSDRPDSITCELDFMQYLILKRLRLGAGGLADDAAEKAEVCLDAEKKFFVEHLEPAATLITREILAKTDHSSYMQAAEGLLKFLSREREHFALKK